MRCEHVNKFNTILSVSLAMLLACAVVGEAQPEGSSGHGSARATSRLPDSGRRKTVSAQPPTITTFQGIGYTGAKPPDPVIAAGPSDVIEVVNTNYTVFTKTGSIVYQGSLQSFFNDNTDQLTDPKVLFDQYSQRWVVLILANDGQTGYYLLGVSQSSDPNPSLWYKYKLNASIDSSQSTGLRPDFSGLGYDANCVYMTSNQYTFAGAFQYAKIRILDKSQIYSGQTPTEPFTDFVHMKDADGSTSFTIKPVQQFGSASAFYLVECKMNGGSAITLWEITNPSTNPQLTLKATIPVKAYAPPPDASQENNLDELSTDYYNGLTNAVYTQDAMYRDGYVYTAFSTAHNWGSGTVSAIQYDKIDVNSSTAVIDDIYGSDGVYYFYPNIYADGYGDIALDFCESSSSEFPGMYWAYRTPFDAAASSPQVLKAGAGPYSYNDASGVDRYGDYSGICLDPVNENEIWMCGEYGTSNTANWGTEVGTFQFPVVKFSNLVNGADAGGSLQINSQTTVTSGTSLSFDLGSGNNELTLAEGGSNQDRFVNTNGVTLAKHNNWDNTASSYLLGNNFTVTGAPSEAETAYFLPLNPATLTASSVDGGSLSGVQLSFTDPWYLVNSGGQQGNTGQAPIPITQTSSPMTGAYNQGTGGVFTFQSGPGSNWAPPYYSVGLPSQSISVGGTNHSLSVAYWSADGANIQNSAAAQTGVEFTSSNATVTAHVKGNLLSSVSSATGYGNQCKIIKDPATGYLFMIYPSAGEIWYTRSTDQGRAWSPEVRISAGDGEARNPSIAQVWNENGNAVITVFVVWVDEYPGLGSGWSVFYNSLDVSTNTWGTTMPVAPPNGGTPVGFARSNAKPSISAITNTSGGSYLTVAFEGAGTGIYIASKSWNDTAWQPLEELSFTDTTCEDPALFAVNYPSVGGFYMYLAYDNAQSIFMSYVSNPTNYDPPPFGSATNITSSIEQGEAAELGLTVDGSGTVRFTWRGYDPFANAFVTWERSYTWAGGSWNTAEFSTPSSSDEPSICGHLGGAGATIMFHVSDNSIWKVESNDGTSWSGAAQLASSAAYPGLVSTANADTIPFVYTKLTTPYAIGMGEVNSGTVTLLQKASPTSGNMEFSAT